MADAPFDALPGVVGIHHVAFAVADLDAAVERWLSFGAQLELRAVVAGQGVEAASLEWHGGGPTLLELVAPAPGEAGEGSSVARFLERSGEGMHHVAWAVRDVADGIASLTRAGARVIDETPRPGLHGTPVAFVHPRSTGGVLVELVEVPAP